MKYQMILTTDNEQFSSFVKDKILTVREKRSIIHLSQNVADVFSLYEYIDLLLSSDTFKAIVMFARSEQSLQTEQSEFLSRIVKCDHGFRYLDRFLNVVNKFILSLSMLNCAKIFAAQGTISLFYLNTAMAYDYRIVEEDTVFENPDLEIGLVTKGSGYFLPRLLGIRKAMEVLQWKRFSAEEALQLGLVDLIVPVSRLEEETMLFASRSKAHQSSTLLGISRLFKCDIKELKHSLDLEDKLIKERIIELRRMFATKRTKRASQCLEGLRGRIQS